MAESLTIVDKARMADPADIKLAPWHAIGTMMVGNVRRRAGDRRKGLEMMKEGMTLLTGLLAKNSLPSGELRYPLAAGFRGRGEDALLRKDLLQALSDYKNAVRAYADDAAAVPDDLGVILNRAETMLEIAAVPAKLGLARDAGDSRRLALTYANRVLKIHPDNPIARKAWLAATAAK